MTDEARRARMIQRQAFPFVVPPVVRLERLSSGSSPPEILRICIGYCMGIGGYA